MIGLLVGVACLVAGLVMLLFAVVFWGYCLSKGGWDTVAMVAVLALFIACGRWAVRTRKSI